MGTGRDLVRALLTVVLVVGSTAGAAGAAGSRAEDGLVGKASIPLKTVTFSGHRYVAPADLGLTSAIPLMVHGNARLHLMLTHDTAARVSGHPVDKREAYGYSRRGKGAVDVAMLRLGGQRFEKLTNVPVFDFTEEPDTTVGGMLGVRFLVESSAAVDFSRDRLLLGVTRSSAPNPALLERGYRHLAFEVSAQGRTTIPVYFPALRRTLPITPSTVSNALTLHHPLFVGKVRLRHTPIPDRSPHGTTPDEYIADRIEFKVADVSCAESAVLEDLAEYARVPAGELESDGMLGFDWMKRHRAILDYANRTLYFLP